MIRVDARHITRAPSPHVVAFSMPLTACTRNMKQLGAGLNAFAMSRGLMRRITDFTE